MSTTAPLVSPEATTDIDKATTEERPIIVATAADDAKDTRRSSSSSTEVKASTVYIKAATEDESSTDPVTASVVLTTAAAAAAAPPPPPRPSKASSSSSSSSSTEASPKHVLSPSAVALKLPLDATVSSEAVKETSGEDVGSLVDDETSKGFSSQQWGTERRVELRRVAGQGLGISIVGGKVDTKESGNFPITGIFIKNVLPGSPADECGQLFTGDRILEVDGHDLRQASHDKAVDVIRQSGNVVEFVVQSLLGLSRNESSTHLEGESSTDEDDENILTDTAEMNNEEEGPPVPPPEFANDEAIDNTKAVGGEQTKDNDDAEEELPPVPPPPQHADEDEEDNAEEDYLPTLELAGQVTLSSGAVIDKASAAYTEKRATDPDTEDDFGYTLAKIRQKYSKRTKDGAQVVYVCINKGSNGLGISLAGDKDRSQSAVYICGLNPSGNAARDGRMKEGDLILEVIFFILDELTIHILNRTLCH